MDQNFFGAWVDGSKRLGSTSSDQTECLEFGKKII